MLFILILLLCSTTFLVGDDLTTTFNREHDKANRPVIDSSGNKILYSTPPLEPLVPAPESHGYRMISSDLFSASASLSLREEYTIGSIGEMLGTTGVEVKDVNADGIPEIFVGHTAYWYMLVYDCLQHIYVQRNFTEYAEQFTFGGGEILQIRVGDVDGDGHDEVVVMFTNASIFIYDAVSGKFKYSRSFGMASPRTFILADIDRSIAGKEILVANQNALYVLAAGDPEPRWMLPVGGVALAVGNVDADSSREILMAGGTNIPGSIIDVNSRTVQWTYAEGFGDHIAAGDVNGDSIDEVIAAENYGSIFVFDAEEHSRTWSVLNPDVDSNAIRVVDIDGNGAAEVLIGDGQWGGVQFRNGKTGDLLFLVKNPLEGVSDFDVADLDADCDLEIVYGAGYYSTGRDALFVFDVKTQQQEWESLQSVGPMVAFTFADMLGDGNVELLHASNRSNEETGSAILTITDLRHATDLSVTPQMNDGRMPTYVLTVGQFDDDRQLEYVTNQSAKGKGQVAVFDPVKHKLQQKTVPLEGEYIASLALADLGGKFPAVVVGTGVEPGADVQAHVRIFGGMDGDKYEGNDTGPSWVSLPAGQGPVTGLQVADLDKDDKPDLVAAIPKDGVWIYNAIDPYKEEWHLGLPEISCVEVASLNGDSNLDILVGDTRGRLVAFDAASKNELFSIPVGNGPIWAIRVADVNKDGDQEILLSLTTDADRDLCAIKIIGAVSKRLVWQSPDLVGNGGRFAGLLLGDFDSDGKMEIAASTQQSIRIFEYEPDKTDKTPPVWEGKTGAQSAEALDSDCCALVLLKWNFSTDEKSPPPVYRVYRSVNPAFSPNPSTLITETTFTSFLDTRVKGGTTYHYIVRTVDRIGNEDSNKVIVSATTSSRCPALPSVGINDVKIPEGSSGTIDAMFTVSLSQASSLDTIVFYITANGPASDLQDYVFTTGAITIPAGDTLATIRVPVRGDKELEKDETFSVALSNPVNAVIGDESGTCTILDDDGSRLIAPSPF